MLRPVLLILAIAALAACNLSEPARLDPAVARRIAELKARLGEKPGDPALLADLALAYADGGRLFDAADAFQSALEHGANDAKTHGGLADTYLRLGYVARAVDELRACMTHDRQSPDCLYTLARLFEAEGSPEALKESRRALHQMIAAAPQHPRRADAEKALDRIEARIGAAGPEEAHAADPRGASPEAGSGPGRMYGGAQDVAREPLIPEHAQGGMLEEGAEAEAPTEEAPADGSQPMIPGHEHKSNGASDVGELNAFGLALQKAFAAVKAEDGATAEKAFREALALHPKDATALAGVAQALIMQSKKDEAMKAAEEALAASPSDPQARYVYGLVMFKAGTNFARALKEWEALAKDEPEYARRVGVIDLLDRLKRKAPPQKK